MIEVTRVLWWMKWQVEFMVDEVTSVVYDGWSEVYGRWSDKEFMVDEVRGEFMVDEVTSRFYSG